MGSYTFKWEHDAEEAFVTGTFDDWQKSVRLDKHGGVFQKTVYLDEPSDKIYYKFVVDNTWTVNESCPHEADRDGNVNNYLTRHDLCTPSVGVGRASVSTVTPEASTVAMAGKKNKQKKQPVTTKAPQQSSDIAAEGAAVGTAPATAPATAAPVESTMGTSATPSGLPGGFPVTPADEVDKTVGINPLPAAPGAVNPIKLEPGQKIPPSMTSHDINENVKLDKESYERSDALPAGPTALPPVSKNLIPESSLPMGSGNDATINTVGPGATTVGLAGKVPLEPKNTGINTIGPGATTVGLAGKVPLEPKNTGINTVGPGATTVGLAGKAPLESKVPEVVKESQSKAGAPPEASSVAKEVQEKAAVEDELKERVKKVPATSEGTSGVGTEKTEKTGLIAGAAATTGGAVVAAAIAAKDTLAEKATPAINDVTAAATDAANKNLPDSVKQKLPESTQSYLAGQTKDDPREKVSAQVPSEVKQSISEAGKSPEAAANTSAVEEKKEVEAELLREVKPAPAVDDAKTAATAPTASKVGEAKATEAKPEAVKSEAAQAEAKTPESKSPEAVKPEATNPKTALAAAPNGTETATAESSSKPAQSSTAEKKKRNRLSTMFTKLKEKLSDKK